ncbi:lytic transglycosylase domain-containing protein [Mangrovimicrobium sediminis]|nr:lytic transglycosylase domain-containing protein [Haliea sp. SAOS-164]
MVRGFCFAILVALSCGAAAEDFPRPASLQPAVQFWTRVYSEVSTDQGYIHDASNLAVVYRQVDLPAMASNSVRERRVRAAKQEIVNALQTLASGKRDGLSATEAQVLGAWPAGTSSQRFAAATRDVRFQLGQSDRFRAGMERSGQWKPFIREVLAEQGLPPELDVLPHVESSFNPDAWSRVAAAGMWQFMPATGRQFMRVDHVVDERMDPFTATEAAARLLKRNYAVTESWPLAVTGYNHGTTGVLRAARAVGSKDIGVIVARYSGPAFGFASRNFYASFLAALDVDRNAARYFPGLQVQQPVDYALLPLDAYVPVKDVARALGLDVAELQRYNPALREPIWDGDKHVPRGYPVRVPRDRLAGLPQSYLAAIPASARHGQQKPDLTHRIAPGDSLWTIARRYGTTVARLKALNGMRGNNIRAGRTLILPGNVMPEPALAASHDSAPSRSAANDVYVIRKGDSLWSIARRFNVSQQQLVAWNALSAQAYLQPGQKLKITAPALSQI